MKEKNDNKIDTIEYRLKCYQIKKQIEEIRKDTVKYVTGSYNDLLKYRRGKSKY